MFIVRIMNILGNRITDGLAGVGRGDFFLPNHNPSSRPRRMEEQTIVSSRVG